MSSYEEIEFDGVKYRRQLNSKHKRLREYFNSVGHTSVPLHRVIWKKFKGEIPKGFHIHHIDGNSINNDISNLQCLSQKEHIEAHAKSMNLSVKEYYQYMKRKGIVWNKTDEGREFKSKQAKAIWAQRKPISLVCPVCEKTFDRYTTRGNASKYCSQKCANRGKFTSGEYAKLSKCIECGNDFVYMKYKPKKTCSKECQSLQHGKTMKNKYQPTRNFR